MAMGFFFFEFQVASFKLSVFGGLSHYTFFAAKMHRIRKNLEVLVILVIGNLKRKRSTQHPLKYLQLRKALSYMS